MGLSLVSSVGGVDLFCV
uniref:Uncharacterized protein n=1 Tax=Arundo donax TaxID=35708 RepID=A0A0A9BJ62_ARUDO